MNLFGWLKGKERREPGARDQWKASWSRAVEGQPGTIAGDAELRQGLEPLAGDGSDIEIELEMLDALEQLRVVQQTVTAGALPSVETHHRVIGVEGCHFSAPSSLSTDQALADGRVLLTGTRAVFVGGGRTSATAWHAVHEIVRLERDVLFVRADRSPAAHFRFNTYADAVVCAFLARHLKNGGRPRL
jgi:hypothetical protein